jgi:hypothetical protein
MEIRFLNWLTRDKKEPEPEWEHPMDEFGRYHSREPQLELKRDFETFKKQSI